MARRKAAAKSTPAETLEPVAVDQGLVHQLAAETLCGDIRDFILDRLRHEQDKRPWHERSEADQRDTVHQVEVSVRDVVTRVIDIIAGGGRNTITAAVESISVKDGIKCVLALSRHDPQRHRLIDATGARVMVVIADPDEFDGEREPVAIKPDQAEMLGDAAMAVHSDGNGHSAPFN